MRILVADDESIIRMGLRTILEQLSHEVVLARDGREALEKCRQINCDLAILDIRMPRLDGLKTAQELYRLKPMPIIILSAFSDEALISQATELPISTYLVKPIAAADLRTAIALANARFAEKRKLVEQSAALAQSLEIRKLLDRAKGRLMEQGMTEREAYLHIQKQARDGRMTVKQVAKAIIAG